MNESIKRLPSPNVSLQSCGNGWRAGGDGDIALDASDLAFAAVVQPLRKFPCTGSRFSATLALYENEQVYDSLSRVRGRRFQRLH